MKPHQLNARSLRLILFCGLLLISLITFEYYFSQVFEKESSHALPDQQVISSFGPRIRFEKNAGQTDPQVAFLCRGRNHILYLTSTGSVMHLNRDDENLNTIPLQMEIVGANPDAKEKGLNQLVSRSNYFRGNDPGRWITDVPNYDRVGFEDIYKNIDLIYYINDNEVEFDFMVKPGAKPELIRMDFSGIEKMKINRNGDLIIQAGGHRLVYRKPMAWQFIDGSRNPVDVQFALADKHKLCFKTGKYDNHETLIIDPQVVYSSYLGGSDNDYAKAIAVDPEGHAYVTGYTMSADFPTYNAYQSEITESIFLNNYDIFVTKFNPQGNDIVYSTYIGGNRNDQAHGIAVDAHGNACVAGWTMSRDNELTPDINESYPLKNGLQQIDFSQNADAIVTVLNASGNDLIYSTLFGGTADDEASSVAIDNSGYAYITGFTWSADLSVKNAYMASMGSQRDAIVAKFNPAASGNASLIYATYLGGDGDDLGKSIAVDLQGCAYVTGETLSTNFPTSLNALQGEKKGNSDAFVTKFAASGLSFEYSILVGGDQSDVAYDIEVDSNGSAYITGKGGDGFPTTPGAMMTSSLYPFVCKLKPDGSDFVYSTNVVISNANTLDVDDLGQAYVAGGWLGAYVLALNTSGSDTLFGVKIGTGTDVATDIVLDDEGNVYITGTTSSAKFPVINGFQTSLGGKTDVFIAKFGIPKKEYLVEVLQDSLHHDAMPIPNTSFDIYSIDLTNTSEPYDYLESLTTDEKGLLHLPDKYYFPGMPILIRYKAETKNAVKSNRNGESTIMYEVYVDNLIIDNNGNITAQSLKTNPGDTTRIYLGHTSLGFNLVVSIEWLASADYVTDLMDAFIKVSNLLYDITNGHAFINHVTIFDDKAFWHDADIQILANNTQWPKADPGGIDSVSDAGHVYLPPVFYHEKDKLQIQMSYEVEPIQPSAPMNITTIVHELGHYLFGFFDEYQQADGILIIKLKTTNFGFMDDADDLNHPRSSEMSDYIVGDSKFDLYSLTEQYRKYHKNCWDMFAINYSKMYGTVKAQIHTPKDLGIFSDNVMTGPNSDPDNPDLSVGDMMDFDMDATLTALPRRDYLLTLPNSSRPASFADVSMIKELTKRELIHGKTTSTGHTRLFNAEPGDRIYFTLNDEGQWKFREILAEPSLKMSGNTAEIVELKSVTGKLFLLSGISFDASGHPVYECQADPFFSVSPAIRIYENDAVTEDQTLSFMNGVYSAALINSDFTEGSVHFSAPDSIGENFIIPQNATVTDIADLGHKPYLSAMRMKLSLNLEETTAEKIALLASGFPGPLAGLPDSVRRVSEIICMNVFPADSKLEVLFQIRYNIDTLEAAVPEAITVYKWENSWIPLTTGVDLVHNTATATVDGPGYYAVFLDLTQSGVVTRSNGNFSLQVQAGCRLYPNYPNPFSSFTTIGFELAANTQMNVSIYDIQGRKVQTLIDKTMTASEHFTVWDGTDETGQKLPAGVYFCVLRTGTSQVYRKMMLIR